MEFLSRREKQLLLSQMIVRGRELELEIKTCLTLFVEFANDAGFRPARVLGCVAALARTDAIAGGGRRASIAQLSAAAFE